MVIGKVLSLYVAPPKTSGVREQKEKIVIKNGGIVGDKFAKKLEQSVMIVGQKPYIKAKENLNINLPNAALGENILLSFNPHELKEGSILEIGGAVLQITQACTLCKHLTKYHNKLPKLILKSRGIYCKVLQDGIIKVGDSVKILERLSA